MIDPENEVSVEGQPGRDSEEVENAPAATSHLDRRRTLAATGFVALCTALMAVALFLPWVAVGSNLRSLAEYAAPEPAVVAWALLALGLATCIVSVLVRFLGPGGGLQPPAVGAFLYGLGAAAWYASSVLPDQVASGCANDGGTLCGSPSGSPTLGHLAVGPGFILGVVSAVVLLVGVVLIQRLAPDPRGKSAEI